MQYKWCTFLFTLINLIVTLALILLFLPATVPTGVNTSLVIDVMGSPFFAILPFAVLPLIFNLVSVLMRDNRLDEEGIKFYHTRDILISIYALISIVIGWLKFSIAYSGGSIGMQLSISPMLFTCMIPALLLFVVSAYLPTLNIKGKGINFGWIMNNPSAWLNTQRLAHIMGLTLSCALYFTNIICYIVGLYKIGFLICGIILLMYIILLVAWSIIWGQTSESTTDTPTLTLENTIPQNTSTKKSVRKTSK